MKVVRVVEVELLVTAEGVVAENAVIAPAAIAQCQRQRPRIVPVPMVKQCHLTIVRVTNTTSVLRAI